MILPSGNGAQELRQHPLQRRGNRGAAYSNGKIFCNTLENHTVAVSSAMASIVLGLGAFVLLGAWSMSSELAL